MLQAKRELITGQAEKGRTNVDLYLFFTPQSFESSFFWGPRGNLIIIPRAPRELPYVSYLTTYLKLPPMVYATTQGYSPLVSTVF